MTIDALIMALGTCVAVLPILQGVPDSWQRPILFLLGIAIVALGIVVRRRGLGDRAHTARKPAAQASTFVESTPVSSHTPETHESA
jgi:hypothetical protein